MGVRRDVLQSDNDRDAYLQGCVALSETGSEVTALDAHRILETQVPGWSMRGTGSVELSRWDLYTLWHYVAMNLMTSPQGTNRAHGGPVFLPWHRMFLIRLEQDLQDVLGLPEFGLPYWDWARDRQLGSLLWADKRLGTVRGEVQRGMLGRHLVQLSGRGSFGQGGYLEAHEYRHIRRNAASDPRFGALPKKSDVAKCLAESAYDSPDWNRTSDGLRSRLEGWRGSPPELHNLVHVWVGGDMGPGTSPNDPLFFLNHCNVDRIWEAWMVRQTSRVYLPGGVTGSGSPGQNLHDAMVSLLGPSMTPAMVLDPSQWYSYDNLRPEI